MFNQDLLDQVIGGYKSRWPVADLIELLVRETRKPLNESKIRLNSLDESQPNLIPWSTLGLRLYKDGDLPGSKRVWRTLLGLAREQAAERYGGIAPVGLPANNLALVLQGQGRTLDALVAVIDAYRYDVETGSDSQVARQNFERLLRTCVLGVLTKPNSEATTPRKSGKDGKKPPGLQLTPPIWGYSLLVWMSFLLPTAAGLILLWCNVAQWHLLFLIAMGLLAPYFYKDVTLRIKDGQISVMNPPTLAPQGHDATEAA